LIAKLKRLYGCPFINAVGEHEKADERLRAIAIVTKQSC
jgi:hypothetical protein